jgi:hypothetical protein
MLHAVVAASCFIWHRRIMVHHEAAAASKQWSLSGIWKDTIRNILIMGSEQQEQPLLDSSVQQSFFLFNTQSLFD